jgi:hypothetical protein
MAIAPTAQLPRPIFPKVGALADADWYQRINWSWWLIRVPMALLAVPSAYGVYGFSLEKLPEFFAGVLGVAFEATYLGAVATADQQHEGDLMSALLWWLVNLGAVAASIICNLLFAAGGSFAGIRPETWAHAVPMPVLGFLYGLMIHRLAAVKAGVVQRHTAATAFPCPYCDRAFPTANARNGHKGRCPKRP